MTWETHQGHGFFGLNPWDNQPRWCGTKEEPNRGRVDIDEALAESEGFRERFWKWVKWDAPPYSGGVLTDWPARDADALAFAKREWAVVQAYLKSLEAKRG